MTDDGGGNGHGIDRLHGIQWLQVPVGVHLRLLDEDHQELHFLEAGNYDCYQAGAKSICEGQTVYYSVRGNLLNTLYDLRKCVREERACNYPVVEIHPSIDTQQRLINKYKQELAHRLVKYDNFADDIIYDDDDIYLTEYQHRRKVVALEEADATLDVTLVTQFSVNRLTRFEDAIRAWSGPIAASIYLMESEDLDTLIEYFTDHTHQALYSRVELAIVLPDIDERDRFRYPINLLRNLATRLVQSSHHLMIDADFVPNHALYREVVQQQLIPIWQQSINDSQDIATTFEVKSGNGTLLSSSTSTLLRGTEWTIPENLKQLHDLFDREQAYITDANAGHGPTSPRHFFIRHGRFPRQNPAPAWDERFRNQGGDKQQHALILNAFNYRFFVLRDVFLYHRDHSRLNWPGGGLVREGSWPVFSYFDGWSAEMANQFGWSVKWPRGCGQSMVMEQFRP
ncbi:hypothetical protein BDF22DRAFT_745133 [Syncephalis plumigaleata]|nr:hypothetical protein BDF22DRAFT_745133 [Syncephalis plumigaleata]